MNFSKLFNQELNNNIRYRKYTNSTMIDSVKKTTLKDEIEHEKVSNMKAERILRLFFSPILLIGVYFYIENVFDILEKCGNVYNMFVLSDSVLITLLSTTTANVVGLLAFVVRYLFPQRKSNKVE